MDKRYWSPDDYNAVVNEIEFNLAPKENIPTFSNPEFRPVMQRLVDPQNYVVVLDDEDLGIRHRNGVSTEYFHAWRDLLDLYRETDRKDAYVYEQELLQIWQFGLGLQLRYFDLGNRLMKESSDDPNSRSTRNSIILNIGTLTDNYMLYLDLIDREELLTPSGISTYTDGLDLYFPELLEWFPEGNYKTLRRKLESLSKKSQSEEIKSSLALITQKLDEIEGREVNVEGD